MAAGRQAGMEGGEESFWGILLLLIHPVGSWNGLWSLGCGKVGGFTLQGASGSGLGQTPERKLT